MVHPEPQARSNFQFCQAAQDKRSNKFWDIKTSTANISRNLRANSNQVSMMRQKFLLNRSAGNIGEFSSQKLSKILSGGDRPCASDNTSEIIRFDPITESIYFPIEQVQIESLYKSVQPCDLISK